MFIIAFPILILAIFGTGLRLLTLFRWEPQSKITMFFLAMTLGSAFLGQFIFFMGLLHLLYGWFIWISLLLMWLLNFPLVILFFREIDWCENFDMIQNISFAERLLFCMGIIVVLLHGFFSLAPQIHWDAMAYHYLVPYFFLQHHAVIDFPDVIFSYYPSIVEMIYLAAMGSGGEQTANLIGWSHTALVYIGIFAIAVSLFKNWRYGIWASIVFLSTQGINMHFEGGWNDMGVAMFIVASILALFDYGQTRHKGAFYYSAILIGAALASKHYAWIPFGYILIFVFFDSIIQRDGFTKSTFSKVIFFLVAFSMPLGWFIRSLILTGNPVYPFSAFGLFPTYHLPPFSETSWINYGFQRGFLSFIEYPFALMFGSFWEPELTGHFSYLLLLSVVSLFAIKKPEIKATWLFILWTLIVMYFIAPFETRYMLYMIPFAALLVGAAIDLLNVRIKAPRGYIFLVAFIVCLAPFLVNQRTFEHDFKDKVRVITKLEWKDKYLFRQSHTYKMFWWMNRNLPSNSRTLCLEQKLYRLDRPYVTWYGMKEKYPETAFEALEKNYRHGNTHMFLGEGGMANPYILWHIYHLPRDPDGNVTFRLEDVLLNLNDEPIPPGFWILRISTRRNFERAGINSFKQNGETYYKMNPERLKDSIANSAAILLVDIFKEMESKGWIILLNSDGLNMLFKFNYIPLESQRTG